MSDYTNANSEVITDRSAKNRFLGLFCHANQVSESWGLNWPFYCGVIMFSILIGIMTLFDVSNIFTDLFENTSNWLLFWVIIKFLSDLIALIGIVFAIMSIIQSNFTRATIGYYCMVLCLLLSTLFCGYCLISIFDKSFWKKTTYRIFVWFLNEFLLVLFCWILFCNMVDIGRQNKKAAANTF